MFIIDRISTFTPDPRVIHQREVKINAMKLEMGSKYLLHPVNHVKHKKDRWIDFK